MAGGDYGRIRHTFWTDPDIKRALSSEQKALLLYYFTSPHSNLIGLYYCPLGYAAAEVGLSLDQVREWTFGALSRFVTYDEASEEVLVHRAGRHQVDEELKAKDNRVKAVEKAVSEAHSPTLVRRFLELYAHWPLDVQAPSEPPPPPRAEEAPPEALRSPSEANAVAVQCNAVAVQCNAVAMHPPGVAHAREPIAPEGLTPPVVQELGSGPLPDDELPEVPGDRGARVIPLRPPPIDELPFQNQDWHGRLSGAQVLAAWIALQPTAPSSPARDRYGGTCKRIADNHSTGEIALAFVGMRYLWPYAPPPIGKSQPWTPEHLWSRFAEAVPAAANHPDFRQRKEAADFDEAFARAKSGGGPFR